MRDMDSWPMWVKGIVATLVMCVFWGILLAPQFWPVLTVPIVVGFLLLCARSFWENLK